MKPINEIISESPKLSEILSNYQLYLAHTPNESLEEHLNLTLSYLSILTEVNQLDTIIDNLILNNLPYESSEVSEWIKEIDNVGKIVPLRRMKQYCCVGVNRTATSE